MDMTIWIILFTQFVLFLKSTTKNKNSVIYIFAYYLNLRNPQSALFTNKTTHPSDLPALYSYNLFVHQIYNLKAQTYIGQQLYFSYYSL